MNQLEELTTKLEELEKTLNSMCGGTYSAYFVEEEITTLKRKIKLVENRGKRI